MADASYSTRESRPIAYVASAIGTARFDQAQDGGIARETRAGGLGAGASDLIDNLLNDSKHRRCRAEQRLRKSVDRAQPQHRIR
jgi:hypothetical protein